MDQDIRFKGYSSNLSEAAFVAQILERPQDMTLRLAYADWLSKKDNPLGEFIRLQIALDTKGKDNPELLARQELLLSEYERVWAEPLPRLALRWQFRCGFVESECVNEKETKIRERSSN